MASVELCVACGKSVGNNAQALSCDECDKWTHRKCGTGLSVAQYKVAVKQGTISFLCVRCKPSGSTQPTAIISTSSDPDSELTEVSEVPVHQPKGKGKGRKRKRATPVPLPVETTTERVTRMRQERVEGLKEVVSQLTEEDSKALILAATEKMPSLIFDVLDKVKPGISSTVPVACASGFPMPGPESDSQQPDWCVCTRCREMPSDEERLCCGLTPQHCLSLRPELEQYCLEPGVLMIANNIRNDIFVRNEDDLNKGFRHAAYRQFIYWRHGRLGSGNRRVVPSCVVWKIRDRFPANLGQYTGFKTGRLL